MTLLATTKRWLTLSATALLTFTTAHGEPCNNYSWCDGVDFTADFIYWKPCFDDLDYAYTAETEGGVIVNDYKYVSHGWKPGFSVALGKKELFCGWNFEGIYTRITGSDSDRVEPESGVDIVPTLAVVGIAGPYTAAKGTHRFSYNSYDLLFSRCCPVASCHTLTPFIGVSGLILDQHIHAQYQTATNLLKVKWSGDYNAVGFRFGTQYDICWNNCWSLFVKGSGAILVGNLDNRQRESALLFSTRKWKNSECIFVPGSHIVLGLSYDTCWCDKLFKFTLGYEFLHWYNLPSARRQEVWTASKTTVGFHGLRTGVNVTF